MRLLLMALSLMAMLAAHSQKVEEGFDFTFKPTSNTPRYYVVTEKKDTLWHRQAFYLPEGGMYMEGWYQDKECTKAQGGFAWYHPNRVLKEKGTFVQGKKHGVWLQFNEDGNMVDSSNYEKGRLKGVSMQWYANGMAADSANFDGAGRGVQVHWYEDGMVRSAGYIVNDTAKNGRWKYFHPNGKVMAVEDYVAGERKTCKCYNEQEVELDSLACAEKEADFPGGTNGWIRFVQGNLRSDVPVRNKAPLGQYTVVMQFVVETDGSITNIKPNTRYGYGMEEEVERMLKKAPKWIPAQQFGKRVKAYRKQPVTFVVQNW